MNYEERKAYMKAMANKAREERRELQMERAAKTADAIHSSPIADPNRLKDFLAGKD